jgi:hypothetical protein
MAMQPDKRKQAGASLQAICRRLGLPFRKTRAYAALNPHTPSTAPQPPSPTAPDRPAS